jgi:hypothetical protein
VAQVVRPMEVQVVETSYLRDLDRRPACGAVGMACVGQPGAVQGVKRRPNGCWPQLAAGLAEPLGKLREGLWFIRAERGQHAPRGREEFARRVGEPGDRIVIDVPEQVPRQRRPAPVRAVDGGITEHEVTRSAAWWELQPADPSYGLFSSDRLGRVRGSCYLALGDGAKAAPILESTARSLHGRHKSKAIVLGNLALAHIRQRDVEHAATVLHRAIDLLEVSRGGGGLNVVFAAVRELRPWRHERLAQDVNERLLTLMATA